MTDETSRSRLLWPSVAAVVTAVVGVFPLLASPTFYVRGDTDAQFAPTWYHLGMLVRSGSWPPVLDPSAWAGGNYAAEALHGIYNPVNILIWVFVSLMPNLAVAVSVVKIVALVVLALGVHVLAREYGASPWAATVAGVTVPFTGYTLFWDAGSWASGLIAFAYLPWVWVLFRKAARGTANPFWAFLVGALAVLGGNPYGTLGVVAVGLAVAVESAVCREWRGLLRVLGVGVAVATVLPLVYLPLVDTVKLAYRSSGPAISDNGKLTASPLDLLGLGAPSYVPAMRAITGPMRVPTTYLAWFVLPLLPWLRRPSVPWRRLSGLGVVAVLYLLLAIGPSKLWLFRWPVRVIEYGYLAIAVAFAVALSAGLRKDKPLLRAGASVALGLLTAVLTLTQHVPHSGVPGRGTVVLLLALALALAVVALAVHLVVRRGSGPALAAVLVAGVAATTFAQTQAYGENQSSRVWHFPHSIAALQARAPELRGTVLQLADLKHLQKSGDDHRLRQAWRSFLAGSMYDVAGVSAVNHYSGMGYEAFTKRLCMTYDGLARRCGYRQVLQPIGPGQPRMVDLMKVQTLVVGPKIARGIPTPAGFRVAHTHLPAAVVLTRTGSLPYPGSRLSHVTGGLRVTGARTLGPTAQQAQVQAQRSGTLSFALLAWPGYTATLGGRDLPVSHDAVGLLTVHVPAGSGGVLHVSFRPPAQHRSVAIAFLGLLGALALGLSPWWRRRRRATSSADVHPEVS